MLVDNKTIAYLICEETTTGEAKVIVEPNKKRMVQVETTLQNSSKFNRNGRKYGKDVLDDGLNRPNIKELITNESWVGEAGHPSNPTIQRQMTIDPRNISHRINKWWWDGYIVKGIVEALNTTMGNDFQNLILQDLKTAYSLRAVGPIKQTIEGNIVQKPLTVVTYDWVFLPSHDDAYQTAIINKVSENGNVINESFCLPILEQQAVGYIKDKSVNFRMVSETLEFCYDSISLSKDGKSVILKESSGDSLIINTEKYISDEISYYMSKFK